MTDISGYVLAIAAIWAVPVATCIVFVVWAIRKDRRESKMTSLLQRSEAPTQPLTAPSNKRLAAVLDNLISNIGTEVARCALLLRTRSHIRVITAPHMKYAAWLKNAVANDLEALRTLRNAESVALGNPPPNAIPFLNATIAAAERDLTALSILGDWLDRA